MDLKAEREHSIFSSPIGYQLALQFPFITDLLKLSMEINGMFSYLEV